MATIVLFVLFLCRKTRRDITLWCVMMRGVAGMGSISANVLLSKNDNNISGVSLFSQIE